MAQRFPVPLLSSGWTALPQQWGSGGFSHRDAEGDWKMLCPAFALTVLPLLEWLNNLTRHRVTKWINVCRISSLLSLGIRTGTYIFLPESVSLVFAHRTFGVVKDDIESRDRMEYFCMFLIEGFPHWKWVAEKLSILCFALCLVKDLTKIH